MVDKRESFLLLFFKKEKLPSLLYRRQDIVQPIGRASDPFQMRILQSAMVIDFNILEVLPVLDQKLDRRLVGFRERNGGREIAWVVEGQAIHRD